MRGRSWSSGAVLDIIAALSGASKGLFVEVAVHSDPFSSVVDSACYSGLM